MENVDEAHLITDRGNSKRLGFHGQGEVKYANETQIITNRSNSKRLGFHAQGEVKYADVVWEGGKMTMIVRITSGVKQE